MAWLMENWGMIVAVLLGISEALALIPVIKSNSIFQLIYNALKSIGSLFKKDPPAPQT